MAAAMLLFADLDADNPLVTRMAAMALLMAAWWITEAIPIPATALLPVALFPLLGIMPGKQVAALYFNHVIFLFIGGFIFALAMQRWELHRRIALRIIMLLGTGPHRLILGFMVATWLLSMWISNTATTMMMVPMALAIILQLKESLGAERVSRYAVGLLIGIAYAASIGGIATLIGTPPNLAFARILKITFPDAPEIDFATWFLFALPLSAVFLVIAWGLLGRLFVGPTGAPAMADAGFFRREYRRLGRMRYEEAVVLGLFALLVFLWMFRRDLTLGGLVIPGWTRLLPHAGFVDDGTIAITVALLLFIIPARADGAPGAPRAADDRSASRARAGAAEPCRSPTPGRLIDWRTASQLQWGIVLLFGGGFALASGFKESGLAEWLGAALTGLGELPPVVMVLAVCTMLTFLTELTSNTATTEMVLPVLGSLAVAIQVHPLLLMIPATLSASCAFMLPVATPPNAIAFGTGEVKMGDMVRAGIILNLVGVVLITLTVYALGAAVLGIEAGQVPGWAGGR